MDFQDSFFAFILALLLMYWVQWSARFFRRMVLDDPAPAPSSIPAVCPDSRDAGTDRGRIAWRRAWHLARLYGPRDFSISRVRRSLQMAGYSPGYAYTLAHRVDSVFYNRMPYHGPRNRLEEFISDRVTA